MRLTHQVAKKMFSRATGPMTMLTRQPVGGRAAGGGLRIGEMELNALLSHGVSIFLKESMMERADKYSMYISDKTGMTSIVNPKKGIYRDYGGYSTKTKIERELNGDLTVVKENVGQFDAKFSHIELPFSCKLMLQEIQTMSLAPRIITDSVTEKWKFMSSEILKNEKALMTGSDETDEDNSRYYKNKGSEATRPMRSLHNLITRELLEGSYSKILNKEEKVYLICQLVAVVIYTHGVN